MALTFDDRQLGRFDVAEHLAGTRRPQRDRRHHREKTLTPIHLSALLIMPDNPGLFWAMDSLAAAAEAGILDGDRYIAQLLASKEDVRAFRLIPRDAGTDKWLNARHFTALKKLGCAELYAVTYATIASFFDPAE